uniref:Phosphomannomutase/phosphoglucomutase n=1 Tax=candidate division WOR-3 bacterium TaxID=2052148 RepID=A0A7C4CA33_UNCW3
MLNPDIFREYDIRGQADTDLTDDAVHLLGRAFGTHALETGSTRCVVGRDVRLSGPRIRRALVDGLVSTGIGVVDIGVVPTPVYYFSLFHLDIPAGMMITASHNPPPENGFKISLGKTTIHGDAIRSLRTLAESGRFRSGRGTLMETDVIPAYIAVCRSKVGIPSRLRVVFDPGNGTAGILLERLFAGTPVEPVFLNLTPDGNFPSHPPDPTVTKYMRELSDKVLELGADCGIGFDGDSDRIGAADEKGRLVYADKLLGILAKDVVSRRPGSTVVFDVKCSQGLVEYLESLGARPLMWKTGHSLVKAKLKEVGGPIAGEMSGHIFIAEDYYGFDDALFAALRLLRIVATTGRSLSSLVGEIPAYENTPEIRVGCPEHLKAAVVGELRDYFRRDYEVIDIDGARVLFPDGWGLVRASNTQAILVLRFEARTRERLAVIQQLFYDRLRRYPELSLPNA